MSNIYNFICAPIHCSIADSQDTHDLDFILTQFPTSIVICEKKYQKAFENATQRVNSIQRIITMDKTENLVEQCFTENALDLDSKCIEEMQKKLVLEFSQVCFLGKILQHKKEGIDHLKFPTRKPEDVVSMQIIFFKFFKIYFNFFLVFLLLEVLQRQKEVFFQNQTGYNM